MKLSSGVLMFLVLLTFGYPVPSFGQTADHLAEIERLMDELYEAERAINPAQLRLLESMYLPAVPNHGGLNGAHFVRMSGNSISTWVFGAGEVTTHSDIIHGTGVNRIFTSTLPFRVVDWEEDTIVLVRLSPAVLRAWVYNDSRSELSRFLNDDTPSYRRQN